MSSLSEPLISVFNRACVCRSFRLDGLQAMLKRTNSPVGSVDLIRHIGALNAEGYLAIGMYIVNHDKAKKVIPELENPSPCDLHKEWREWYREGFKKNYNVEDLAELLYHEAAYFKTCWGQEGNVLRYLKKKTEEYLKLYVKAEHRNTRRNVAEYIQKLIQQFQREELNRIIGWILSRSDYETFLEFLGSLNLLDGEE